MALNQRVLEILVKAKDEATETFKRLSKGADETLGDIGKAGVAVTAFGVGMAVALNKAADAAVEYGKEVLTIQRFTGETAEASSTFAAILGRLGIDGTQTGRVFKALDTAIVGNSEALKAMGIATEDVTGKHRGAISVLRDVSDYYAKASDKTEALALASSVLGKGYQTLLPLLAGGAEGFDKLAKKAAEAGLVMDQDEIENIRKYSAAVKDNEESVNSLTVQFGLMVLPIKTLVEQYLSRFLQGMQALPKPVKDTAGGIVIFGTGLANVLGPFLTYIALLPEFAKGWRMVATAMKAAHVSALGPVAIALAAVGAAIYNANVRVMGLNGWPAIISTVVIAFGGLFRAFAEFPKFRKQVEDALAAMNRAMGISVNYFVKVWDWGLASIRRNWDSFVRFIDWCVTKFNAARDAMDPFAKHSPSLVENVMTGTAAMGAYYVRMASVVVGAMDEVRRATAAAIIPPALIPALVPPGPREGWNFIGYETGPTGVRSPVYDRGANPWTGDQWLGPQNTAPQIRIYLDGRELSRSLGTVTVGQSRSGAR